MERKEYRIPKIDVLQIAEDIISTAGSGETTEIDGKIFSVKSLTPDWLD